jgi:hypothetical protein
VEEQITGGGDGVVLRAVQFTERVQPGGRKPTDLCRAATSASRSRAAASPPGLMVSTRKIAAVLSGVTIGCGSGDGCCGAVIAV